MVALTGWVSSSPVGGFVTPQLSTDLRLYSVDYWPTHANEIVAAAPIAGAVASALPVTTTPSAKTGVVSNGYFNDFYNRIHIIPRPIALGSIVADKVVPMELWNAFLTEKTLTAIEVPDGLGITIDGPSGFAYPYTLTPLMDLPLTLSASGNTGAAAIHDSLGFDVSGTTYLVGVTGVRLILFPFPPNWSSPLDETFNYNSWVLPGADGSEQTGSNWGNQPRRTFEFTVFVRGKQMQRLENMLFGWQHQLFGLPHWADKSKLTLDVAAGSAVLAFDTTDRSFEVGGTAVLYKDADTYETFQVGAMTSSGVTAVSPLTSTWPQGTRVYPVSAAMLSENTGGTHQTDNAIVLPVVFECEPSRSPNNNPIGGATTMYRGEELYLGRLDWASPLSFQQDSDRRTLDYKTGTFKNYSLQGFSKQTRKHNWQARNRAEARDLRAWMGRREGVARPVYMPTGKSDMTLAAPILLNASTVDVVDMDYATFVNAAAARRDFIILLRDGTYVARRITEAQQLVGGAVRLKIDAPITRAINAAQIKRICYLNLCRLTGNSVTIRWLTDEIGTAETTLVTKVAP